MPKELVNRAAEPAIGGAPYGDMAEVSGPPTIDYVVDVYRRFLATDARSILCLLTPHHFNFILNPAMRVDTHGWSVSGPPSSPVSTSEVAATTDAAANSAALVNVRANGTDGNTVTVTETVDKPLLATAIARWDSNSRGVDRLPDLTGNGRDAVYGAAAAAPVVLPHTGNDYLSVYTGTASNNHIDGITPNVPATATLTWDIETTASLGGTGFTLIHNAAINGTMYIYITAGGAFTVTTWVSGVPRTLTWLSAVVVNTRKTYRLDLTTTGAELFIDEVSQTLKTFGATRIPAVNTSSVMLQTQSATTPTYFRIYWFNLYGQIVFDPSKSGAYVSADYTTVLNGGSQGGTWTIRRATSGFKTVVVDRPLLLFGGATTLLSTGMVGQRARTRMLLWREFGQQSGTTGLLMGDGGSGTTPGGGMYMAADGTYYGRSSLTIGTETGVSGTSAAALNGQRSVTHVIANNLLTMYVDSTKTTLDPPVGDTFDDPLVAGPAFGILSYPDGTLRATGEFIAAAVWDRVLDDEEVAQAQSEMLGVKSFTPEKTTITYVLATGQTVAKATVPFPVTGDLVGYTAWNPLTSIDPESWVGRSFYFSGAGTIRFNDPKPPGNYGVYVGVSKDILTDDFYEPGRNSGQWTFSAYVKGSCEVRLVMDAYAPVDNLIAYSPPKYWGLPQVADPRVAPYDAAKPAIQETSTQNVWLLKEQEYYRLVGRPPAISSPSTYVPGVVPHEYILNSANTEVWKIKDPLPAAAPYYVNVGSRIDKSPPWDPYTAPPVDKYVRFMTPTDPTNDLTIWEVLSPSEPPFNGTTPGLQYYEDTGTNAAIGTAATEWTRVVDGDWTRMMVQTGVRWGYFEEGNAFLGCGWIDARLEFRDAKGARFSAFMLDPTEYPVAQYFDGSMTEDAVVDDFLWATSDLTAVNNSVSEYYYDRMTRVRFLQEHLKDHIPAGRPYQLFLGSYDDPYIPPENQPSGQSVMAVQQHRKI